MAPARRGRPAFRVGAQGAGATRGRGLDHGRGRGTGSYRGHTKSIFHSTRVEESIADGIRSESTHSDEDGKTALHDISPSSNSETEDETAETGRPYNDLLQSLNAEITRAEPQQKKRRLQANNDQKQVSDSKGPSDTTATICHNKATNTTAESKIEIETETEDEADDDSAFGEFERVSDTDHEDTGMTLLHLYTFFRVLLGS